MATGNKKRRVFEGEHELLDFARSYLSEAFPNPERKGCPTGDALRVQASRPIKSGESISDHLTCCSPCFNEYMGHLAQAKAKPVQSERSHRATWFRRSLVAAGVAVMLMIAFYLFFNRGRSNPIVAPLTPGPSGNPGTSATPPATAMYVPVLVDLSNASPVRGPDHTGAASSPQMIPSVPLIDFTLQLPIGSEARGYSVRLISKRKVIWSGSAHGHLEKGQMLLHMHADFRQVTVGTYDLVVLSKPFRLSVPVVISSSGGNNKR